MMSHINSYTRKKLNNQSAHRLFSFLYGDTILPSLGIQEIPANDINLTPPTAQKVKIKLLLFGIYPYAGVEVTFANFAKNTSTSAWHAHF